MPVGIREASAAASPAQASSDAYIELCGLPVTARRRSKHYDVFASYGYGRTVCHGDFEGRLARSTYWHVLSSQAVDVAGRSAMAMCTRALDQSTLCVGSHRQSAMATLLVDYGAGFSSY